MSPIAQISNALRYDDVEAILALGPGTLGMALRLAAMRASYPPIDISEPETLRTTELACHIGDTKVCPR